MRGERNKKERMGKSKKASEGGGEKDKREHVGPGGDEEKKELVDVRVRVGVR